MSNASIGISASVAALIELDPMSVYRKARDLIARYPSSEPVITELIATYGKVIDDLSDDFAMLDRFQR